MKDYGAHQLMKCNCVMKELIHICSANRVHLVPDICKDLVEQLKDYSHNFLLIGASVDNKAVYTNLLNRYTNVSYSFYDKLENVKSCDRMIKESITFTHGLTYLNSVKLKLYGFKNVHWICWGESVNKSHGLSASLFYPVKRFLMGKIDGVITLMSSDEEKLKNNYGLRRVETIGYFSASKSTDFSKEELYSKPLTHKVLLGNNSSCISDFIKHVENLKRFAGLIEVHCLLNYNLNKDDRYNQLIKLGQEYYGDKFSTIENFMTQNEYLDFLKGYDIYICGELRQTGLGAINRALRLGIKVYLNGNNLEWFKQLGCVVYSTSQISQQSFVEFEAPLSFDERITNYNCISSFLDESETLNKWVNYIEKNY